MLEFADRSVDMAQPIEMDQQSTVVVAGSNLPPGTIFGPLRGFEFPAVWIDDDTMALCKHTIQVFEQKGQLTSDHDGIQWLRHLRSSRDIYEQNMEAVRSRDNYVYLRVTRPVEPGELLCGWYEERYARDLNVPHLTMRNIFGVQDYRCHMCNRKFNFPNQLKAHIMYNCRSNLQNKSTNNNNNNNNDLDIIKPVYNKGLQSPEYLLDKRSREESQSTSDIQTMPQQWLSTGIHYKVGNMEEVACQILASFNYQMSCELNRYSLSRSTGNYVEPRIKSTSTLDSRFVIDPSAINPSLGIVRNTIESGTGIDSSTFGPASTNKSIITKDRGTLDSRLAIDPFILDYKITKHPIGHVSKLDKQPTNSSVNQRLSNEYVTNSNCSASSPEQFDNVRDSNRNLDTLDEEPLEVLHKSFIEFSTKRGHLCIYCGKFYSRKYGLKIHLRTHTGYKPLKCKICFRAFGDPSNLNKHIRLHAEGSTSYRCPHCGKILVRRRDLVRHLKSRHPGEKIHV